jgi:hypothetical protein
MSALLKYVKHTIFLTTALALALYAGLLSFEFVGMWKGDSIAPVPAKPEAAVVPVDPVRGALVDEEFDYQAVQRLGSLEGWRGFLATHGNSVYAQSARADVEQLFLAEKAPAPAADVSHGASTDASATSEAAIDPIPPPSGTEVRSAHAIPAPAAGDVSNDAPPGTQAAGEATRPASPLVRTNVAGLTPDETCKRDGDRLARLRGSPSGEETQRFARELSCEKLRPQLQRLMESLGFAPAPAPANSSHADSLLTRVCASQRAALDRLREKPSAEAVWLFWRDLQCEPLRPQVRLLMESLNLTPESLGSAVAPGAAEGHEGATPDARTSKGADPVTCRRETTELNRIRAAPDLGEAKRFAGIVTCDVLKPQATRLLESLTE